MKCGILFFFALALMGCAHTEKNVAEPRNPAATEVPDLSFLKSRNPDEPIKDLKACLFGKDEENNMGDTPYLEPSEKIRDFCNQNFNQGNTSEKSLVFISSNTLVGFKNVKSKHSKLGAWVKGEKGLEEETMALAQEFAATRAMKSCQDYAASRQLPESNCQFLDWFESYKAYPDYQHINFPFEGGYWSRAVVVLTH